MSSPVDADAVVRGLKPSTRNALIAVRGARVGLAGKLLCEVLPAKELEVLLALRVVEVFDRVPGRLAPLVRLSEFGEDVVEAAARYRTSATPRIEQLLV